MFMIPEGQMRQKDGFTGYECNGLFAEGSNQEVVRVQRQMMAVILRRADCENDNRLFFDKIPHFRPGQPVVVSLLTRGHASASLFMGCIS
jgi:hypothetical protein